MKKIWKLLPEPPNSFYEQYPELPKVVARLLFHRGLKTQEKIDEFLNPDYSQDIHDPYLFKDMEKAVGRIFEAVEKDEKIIVYGDYDADGVSAATILVSSIKEMGSKNIDVFLPHRETDGYGLNTKSIQLLADEKTNLIISCDCGISNNEEVEFANSLGLDIIITDHHSIPDILPSAYAIIHPKVEDETYTDKWLSGGAVAFKLMQGLLIKHKEKHETLVSGDKHEAWEKWMLDMVAISSVADMVPLLGESRTLTKYGLIVLNKTKRIGLQKLLLEARLRHEDGTNKKELTADTIGFQIAPRINAAGRLNHANVAYKLMVTKDPIEATDLAFELNKNNQDRQKLTEKCTKEAIEQVEESQKDNPVLFVIGKDWSPGIVGLIASRIKERYYKPTIAMAHHKDEIMGSGRSIDGFDMIGAMQELPDYFSKFGGHPMACGFTLESLESLEPFKEAFIKKFNEKTDGIDVSAVLEIDTEIELEDVNWDLYDILDKFEPFGKENPKPKYLAKGVSIKNVDPLGKDGRHIKILGQHKTPKIKKFVGWNFCGDKRDDNWCKILNVGDIIDIVFEIGVNEWNGNRELQLTIKDIRRACDTNDANSNANVANYANSEIENTNAEKINSDSSIIYKDLSYELNGILFEVHNELGRNCNEKQVCDAIEAKLKEKDYNYEREKVLPESFEGERFGRNRIDFIVEEKIILEIKCKRFVGKEEYRQCMRYLETFDKKLCLLTNYRDKHLNIKRVLNSKAKI